MKGLPNINDCTIAVIGLGYVGLPVAIEFARTRKSLIDKKLLNKIIYENKIDTIIHLAAYLNVSEAENNRKKYYKNNIIGTKNLIEACKNSNVNNFIFSSSCSIYGNVKGAVSENKKPNPLGYYAYTKYKGENLIKKYLMNL